MIYCSCTFGIFFPFFFFKSGNKAVIPKLFTSHIITVVEVQMRRIYCSKGFFFFFSWMENVSSSIWKVEFHLELFCRLASPLPWIASGILFVVQWVFFFSCCWTCLIPPQQQQIIYVWGLGWGGAVKTFKQLIKCLLRLPPPYFCSVSRLPGRESAHTVCNQPTGSDSAVSMLGSSPRKIAQHQTKNYKNPVKKKKTKNRNVLNILKYSFIHQRNDELSVSLPNVVIPKWRLAYLSMMNTAI